MACSPNLNVELSTSEYCDDNYMDGDDYLVVMVYVNQYCLDTFACLVLDANILRLINLIWLINMLNSS
jgi:hypothetical protein